MRGNKLQIRLRHQAFRVDCVFPPLPLPSRKRKRERKREREREQSLIDWPRRFSSLLLSLRFIAVVESGTIRLFSPSLCIYRSGQTARVAQCLVLFFPYTCTPSLCYVRGLFIFSLSLPLRIRVCSCFPIHSFSFFSPFRLFCRVRARRSILLFIPGSRGGGIFSVATYPA